MWCANRSQLEGGRAAGGEPVVEHYGVTLDPAILMDVNHQPLTIQQSDNPCSRSLAVA